MNEFPLIQKLDWLGTPGYLLIFTFLLSLFATPLMIRYFPRWGIRQRVRTDGPTTHLQKQGIPTMGGVLFLMVFLLPLFHRLSGRGGLTRTEVVFWVVCGVASLSGLLDDVLKMRGGTAGLRARYRILLQIFLGALLGWTAYASGRSQIFIPFSDQIPDIGKGCILLAILAYMGTVNGVNFTDGLDGLLTGCILFTFFAYGSLFWSYLPEIMLPLWVLSGVSLGFLVWNAYPAKIFMGEVGSSLLGAVLASVAILTRTELFLFLFGAVYAVEVLSVIFQVISFHLFGKRIFRMSPLHHHLEMSGMEEPRVVLAFWIFHFLFTLLGVGAVESSAIPEAIQWAI